MKRQNVNWKPGEPHPVRGHKGTMAAIVRHEKFEVSERSFEKWPLTVTKVNGWKLYETSEVLAHADQILARAPRYRQTPVQVAEAAGVSREALQPRLTELRQDGLVETTGARRRNRSGKSAALPR